MGAEGLEPPTFAV